MQVRDVMTRDVVTVSVDTPVSNAINLLAGHGVAALPVLADDHLVGMVSEADVLRQAVPRAGDTDEALSDVGDMTYADIDVQASASVDVVADVMTTPVVTVPESADTADVAGLMLDYEVRSVPVVVERDRVTGIVSRRDLIRTLVRDNRQMAEEIRRRLRDYSGEPDRWTVEVNGEAATITGAFDDANERRVVELLAHSVVGVQTVQMVDANSQSSPDTDRVGQSDTRAG